MNRTATLCLAILAGVAGGVASRYFVPVTAFAQAQTILPKEVRAESFILTDDSGKTLGVFTAKPQRPAGEPPSIILLDAKGKQIWSAGDSPLRQLTQ
jgi:hypothetical protein